MKITNEPEKPEEYEPFSKGFNYHRKFILRKQFSWVSGVEWEEGESLFMYSRKLRNANWMRIGWVMPTLAFIQIVFLYLIVSYLVDKIAPYSTPYVQYLIDLWSPENSDKLALAGTFLIVLIGYLFYLFKKASQVSYGLAEICIACISSYYAFNVVIKTNPSILGFLTPIFASIYFMHRGITNYMDGTKIEEEKDEKRKQEKT